MNDLWTSVLKKARNEKVKDLEQELSYLKTEPIGSRVECPLCHYQSKNGKHSAKIFISEEGKHSVKCFNCNFWRIIK